MRADPMVKLRTKFGGDDDMMPRTIAANKHVKVLVKKSLTKHLNFESLQDMTEL